jgi:hypothetical protein
VEAGDNLIFILGVTMRSGTNYLNNLLLLHPHCEYPGIVWEDYFLAHADLLQNYADSLYKHWQPEWKEKLVDLIGINPVMKSLGGGLTFLLKDQFRGRARPESVESWDSLKFVTATPSVRNLNYFFDLFPDAHLLIIMRDGRSVVESGVRSFDWDYERAMKNWKNAAETIHKFDHAISNHKKKYLILKYEDLFLHTREKMKEVLEFLELNFKCYHFYAAENLPVVGSSELRNSEGAVHWHARKKNKHFDPLERWRHWKKLLHLRFNWIAGDYAERFGYSMQEKNRYGFIWRVWNKVMDFLLELEMKLKQGNTFALPFIRRLRYSLFSAIKKN